MNQFRALTVDDAPALRDLRLQALEEKRQFFTTSYDQEKSRTLQQWREAAQETEKRAIIGAFVDGKLIAMVGARPWDKDDTGLTAYWHSEYTSPEWRGKQITGELLKRRDQWCRSHGYQKAVFTINEENKKAQAVHESKGAIKFDEEPMRFADDNVYKAFWYMRRIHDELVQMPTYSTAPRLAAG